MHIFSKSSSVLSFPNLLSCITLTMLLDTCIFAPLMHTQFGPFSVSPKTGLSTLTKQSDYTEEYLSSILGSSESPFDQVLLCPILISKLYSTQIINECEFLDNSGVSRFRSIAISQSVSLSLKNVLSDIMDIKLPLILTRKFDQMKEWDPSMNIASSYYNLYTAQKLLRYFIVTLSLLSFAAKTVVFGPLHHMTVVSTDIALIVSCLSLILTLAVSQFKLPLRHFPTLISLLFLCSLSLLFDVIEKSMARKYQNFIEAPHGCVLSMKGVQVSPSTPLSQEAKFFNPSENLNVQVLQYDQPIRDEDTISLDLEAPITSEDTCERKKMNFAFSNPNLVTSSDFEAILATNMRQPLSGNDLQRIG